MVGDDPGGRPNEGCRRRKGHFVGACVVAGVRMSGDTFGQNSGLCVLC